MSTTWQVFWFIVAVWLFAWAFTTITTPRDRRHLPGSLARDDKWDEIDDWEQHCLDVPGLVGPTWDEFEETPAFDDMARRFPETVAWLEARGLDEEWQRESDDRGYSR